MERQSGTISDMNVHGCFILTGGRVKTDELVSVEMSVPALLHMQLWGVVVYTAEEIGFAVRFHDLSATNQTLLARVVEHFKQTGQKNKMDS